jgi:cholesterol transport system auxiliary component
VRRLYALALIAPLLAGCMGSAPPVPRDHYYRLLVPGPAETRADTPFPGVMSVEPLKADGLLRERPLLFSESGASYEVQQHDYHYWTDTPPRMLQDQMVSYLRRSGIAGSVVTPDMRIRPDYQVSGKAKRMERLLGGGPPRVYVEIELALVRLADGALVMVDSFAEEEPVSDDSVDASVRALNRATRRVFDRFLTEAVSSASHGPGGPGAAPRRQ